MENSSESENNTDTTVCGEFETIYSDYFSGLSETWDALNRQIVKAQAEYWGAACGGLSSTNADQQPSPEAAFRDYVKAVRVAWDSAQDDYTASYQGYLDAYKSTWSKSDMKDVAPETIAVISQSASLVAGYARFSIGNPSPIAWSGVPPWLIAMTE